MVVLLQELQEKALADLAVENLDDLCKALFGGWVLGRVRLGLDEFLDLRLVGLVLLLTDVECNLVGVQVRFALLINQVFEQSRGTLRDLQKELAKCNVVRVEVAILAPVLVNNQKQSEHLSAEVFRSDNLLGNSEGVCQVRLHLGARKLNGLADLVQPAALERNADDVPVLLVFEAALEHLVDDGLQFGIDTGWLALLHGLKGRELDFLVVVDALVDQLLNVLGPLIEVEFALRVQCKHQGFLEVFEIVVHLRSDLAGQGTLTELLVFGKLLDA